MRAKYIVRLDDACPQMNHENWHRMEELLDKYQVKPLVGVIPDNHDPEFTWPEDERFWERARSWQDKGWTIAQHGCRHLYLPEAKRRYFQKSHSLHTEWAGVDGEVQKQMMREGYNLLRENGLSPTGFFAPAHTFDGNTVTACKRIPELKFISDGYGLMPYRKAGMTFLPSICDGPFLMKVPGIFTFVAHPSVMSVESFARWEKFLQQAHNDVISIPKAMKKIKKQQGLLGHSLEYGIYAARGMRNWLKKIDLM